MVYDMIVLGSGPAGLAAAIAASGRDKSVLVIGNRWQDSPLAKAERVDNYPGLPGRTGLELLEEFYRHAQSAGAEFVVGRALSLLAWEGFSITVGSQVYRGKALILAPGVVRAAKYPGEAEYLGRGVSYCATCDGMLYRNKPIVCAGDAPNFAEEVEFLRSIGCQATEAKLAGLEILGTDRVTGVRDAKGEEIPCDGVFLLRASIAPAQLVPGLDLEDGYIKVDGRMSAGLPGVFAAGDCTGQPLQLAKAVGQGQIAAHFAIEGMA